MDYKLKCPVAAGHGDDAKVSEGGRAKHTTPRVNPVNKAKLNPIDKAKLRPTSRALALKAYLYDWVGLTFSNRGERKELWKEYRALEACAKRIGILARIKDICLGCVGGGYSDVRDCASTSCPLHGVRPFQQPPFKVAALGRGRPQNLRPNCVIERSPARLATTLTPRPIARETGRKGRKNGPSVDVGGAA